MNRLLVLSAVLVLLLVGSSVFIIYQYSETQRVTNEKLDLKRQLDDAVQQLRQADQENALLRNQLNETRRKLNATQEHVATLETQVQELQNKTRTLEEQIEELQDKLRRESYTTVGLTFMWNPQIKVNETRLLMLVDYMNKVQWNPLSIYFFVYATRTFHWMPTTYRCSGGSIWKWAETALRIYAAQDIPVGLFQQSETAAAGCAYNRQVIAVVVYPIGAATLSTQQSDWDWQRNTAARAAKLLTHELEHVLGISDSEIKAIPGSDAIIPTEWYARIQHAAKIFQMSLPDDYVF